ncbi:MAG: SDR family NAD(P)-dependent oxidoreductase [Alteraurantiacibacter sp.]
MAHLFIFGLGYTAKYIAKLAAKAGWRVSATGSDGDLDFADRDSVLPVLDCASHILSSIPPERDSGTDPVLQTYGDALGDRWLGYLSSTGVYGGTDGAWVDETAPTGTGRRTARAECDAAWLDRGARVFRLPGIYGPGRSGFDRVQSGKAHRIDLPGQVFSRVHVEDITSGVMAALTSDAPSGAYNLSDDLPTSQNSVIEETCRLLDIAPPPLQIIEEAGLSPMARGFYAENRRVANGKAKRVLGWEPAYPTYIEGLRAVKEQAWSG